MSTVLVPCDVEPHAGLGLGHETLLMALRAAEPAWLVRGVCRAFRDGRRAESARAAEAVTSLERAIVALRCGLPRSAAFNAAMSTGRLDILKELARGWREWIDCVVRDETWQLAAESGHLGTMRWVASVGYRVATTAWCGAAATAQMDVIDWLHTIECPVDEMAPIYAVLHGHMCVAKRLRTLYGRLPSPVAVAYAGRVDWLDWLESEGEAVPCHGPCYYAAAGGHLDALRWLRDRHFPWDEATTWVAARHGHLAVWMYACAHGCPSRPGKFKCRAAIEY